MLTFQFLAVVVCWMVEVFKVLSLDRVQQRLLVEVFMVLSQDRAQQCLFLEVPKGLLPNRVQQHIVEQIPVLVFKALSLGRFHQRLVELSLVLVLKALSQDRFQQRFAEHITPVFKVSCWDRVHHRLVVLFTATSSRRTRRKGWRRKKCWERWSMSPSTASISLPSAPGASAATSWLGAAGEDGAARWYEQELHPFSLP